MALLVEARYEKPAILEAYLNEIYLGQRGPTSIHGVGEASLLLLRQAACARCGLAEAALLAGLIQQPGRLLALPASRSARTRVAISCCG